ncbi:hypothetical protein HanIR_Chr04g0203621 [Helianthus annuus]|nr:hypothetical protein HanIR_Chr04g0203621 [Helianthus annuus]
MHVTENKVDCYTFLDCCKNKVCCYIFSQIIVKTKRLLQKKSVLLHFFVLQK